jgi:hypothetical protein
MTNFGDGSVAARLNAEAAGPFNVDAWDESGGLAEDVSARGDARRIVSLHVGSGLTSIRGAKTEDIGGDDNDNQ